MVAQIIPLGRTPRGKNLFDYHIPEKLESAVAPGVWVEIKLRGKEALGMIYKTQKTSLFPNLLDIQAIASIPAMPEYWVQWIIRIADYYKISWPTQLYLSVPEFPKKNYAIPAPTYFGKPAGQNDALFQYSDIPAKEQKIIEIIKDNIKKNIQTLFLTPSIESCLYWKQRLEALLERDLPVLHHEMAAVPYFKNYFSAPSEPLVLGTKMALFAPMPQLGAMIIDEYHSDEYKQFAQHPRYDARICSAWLSETRQVNRSLFASSLPLSLVSPHFRARKIASREASLPLIVPQENTGPDKPLSFLIESEIQKNLDDNREVFIFMAKKDPMAAGAIYQKFLAKKNLIHIGNKELLPLFKYQKHPLGSIIILNLDAFLFLPVWNIKEKIVSTSLELSAIANGSGVLIQTRYPDNPIMTAIGSGNTQQFIKNELEERKMFAYPPFGHWILLESMPKKSEDARRLCTELARILPSQIQGIHIHGPFRNKKRTLPDSLLLRVPKGRDFSKLNLILENLDPSWKIEMDPPEWNLET
ncbi:MAG: primosomal protein N' (replication factor Y) (superfamily II helicase) [Parcubacteria group bacterium Gr01-1014_18]|nr:MAG: primosomal protein N' (replication factor Y) (superfamily II helicase) [Parcubacteria group bacterium Greene0416_36]TSC79521.1 MAG: primosomal protein N' (replication factor Y) (superfamily II helicase) [Parcubacteria group bacterium Gr01-1014_18]TSC97991.1 MAG: primosomal protein N' (replication factor Y) (superfamily II helicase) [Parcubacteria group bacterium Greene1014_20]TSD06135.1 MAG: primosomal protein N' (replication factor Y) (superfamily II helicase) [Parcubacteria group bacte